MDVKQDSIVSGVSITPLKIISDDRGAVMHMIRSDSDGYKQFGEVYFSLTRPGVVKGWKRHLKMTQNFVVPQGLIKLVIVDKRQDSDTEGVTQTIVLGRPGHYKRVTIPPMLWYGFQAISTDDAILANCADRVHDKNESQALPLNGGSINYEW